MDPKTAAIGIIAVAALAVAIAKPTTKELVAASQEAETITQVLKSDPILQTKICERGLARVDGAKSTSLIWICNGAGMPKKDQAWLDSITDADTERVVLDPVQDGDNVAVSVRLYKKEAVETKPK